MSIKTYSELIELKTFKDRYEYLKLNGSVGFETFGFSRYLNQSFYSSDMWKKIRRRVILRDNGCDLGLDGFEIQNRLYIHHINPISPEDFENESQSLIDMNNLICVSFNTHQAIHYGDETMLPSDPIIRKPFDTCPWR